MAHEPARTPAFHSSADAKTLRRLDAPNGLTEHRASFDRRDLIRQICQESTAGITTDEALDLSEDYLGSRRVVSLAEPRIERIRRGDGRSAPIPTDTHRWTTPDMLRTERHLIQMAIYRQRSGAGLAHPDHVEQAIADRATLSSGQQVMVRRICGSGDGVDVVPGVAGSGKTHAPAQCHRRPPPAAVPPQSDQHLGPSRTVQPHGGLLCDPSRRTTRTMVETPTQNADPANVLSP